MTGERSQPEVTGTLLRDGKPVAAVPVRCKGRTGESTALTDGAGAYRCEAVKTHLIVFGDTGCFVTVVFELPEAHTLTLGTRGGTRPCNRDETATVSCEVKGTLTRDVNLNQGASPEASCR